MTSLSNAILTPERKLIKKSTTKPPQTHRVPTHESASEDEQEEVEEVPRAPPKPYLSSIDINIEKFEVCCITIFDEKKLALVDGSFSLKEFKVVDCNVKVIKIMEKETEKTKIDFE